jgi:hypothetical protein
LLKTPTRKFAIRNLEITVSGLPHARMNAPNFGLDLAKVHMLPSRAQADQNRFQKKLILHADGGRKIDQLTELLTMPLLVPVEGEVKFVFFRFCLFA